MWSLKWPTEIKIPKLDVSLVKLHSMQKGSDNQDIWMRLLKLVPTSWVAFTEQCNAIPCGTVCLAALWEGKSGFPGISFQTWFTNLKSIHRPCVSLVFTLVSWRHGHLEGHCPETFASHFLTLGGFMNNSPINTDSTRIKPQASRLASDCLRFLTLSISLECWPWPCLASCTNLLSEPGTNRGRRDLS